MNFIKLVEETTGEDGVATDINVSFLNVDHIVSVRRHLTPARSAVYISLPNGNQRNLVDAKSNLASQFIKQWNQLLEDDVTSQSQS